MIYHLFQEKPRRSVDAFGARTLSNISNITMFRLSVARAESVDKSWYLLGRKFKPPSRLFSFCSQYRKQYPPELYPEGQEPFFEWHTWPNCRQDSIPARIVSRGTGTILRNGILGRTARFTILPPNYTPKGKSSFSIVCGFRMESYRRASSKQYFPLNCIPKDRNHSWDCHLAEPPARHTR